MLVQTGVTFVTSDYMAMPLQWFRGCSNINISKLLVIDQTEALWIINTTTSATVPSHQGNIG